MYKTNLVVHCCGRITIKIFVLIVFLTIMYTQDKFQTEFTRYTRVFLFILNSERSAKLHVFAQTSRVHPDRANRELFSSTRGIKHAYCYTWKFIRAQWTPLIRLTLGPAQSESYNRMNLTGEVGKKRNIYELFLRHILFYFNLLKYIHIMYYLSVTKRKTYD